MSTTTSYTVTGMTCQHCVDAVTEEVGQLPGVSDVQADLASGAVDIVSDTPVAQEAVRGAVEEAGYTLAAR